MVRITGFERTELVGDITKQVNLDIKLQEKINEIYEESYLEASETYGWDLPEYKPLMVEVTEQRADKPTGAGERPLRVLSLGKRSLLCFSSKLMYEL